MRSIGRIDGYDTLLSRNGFLSEAEKLGLEVPVTMEIATEADLKTALHMIGFPAVIKADGSWGGEGVFFAQNFDEAVGAFRHLALGAFAAAQPCTGSQAAGRTFPPASRRAAGLCDQRAAFRRRQTRNLRFRLLEGRGSGEPAHGRGFRP